MGNSKIPPSKIKINKIKTPKWISTIFGTVDYVQKIHPQTKFGDNRISGGFWGICEIYDFCHCFSQMELEVTRPHQFSLKMAFKNVVNINPYQIGHVILR